MEHYKTVVFAGAKKNGIPIGPRWIGGLCHRAWLLFDRLSLIENGDVKIPTLSECAKIGVAEGLNLRNIKTEYYRWRRFNNFPSAAKI
jgi:hypothetical protein